MEPNTIGEDHMLQGYKLREMRKESLQQWRLIHLNLLRWNIKNGRTAYQIKGDRGFYMGDQIVKEK